VSLVLVFVALLGFVLWCCSYIVYIFGGLSMLLLLYYSLVWVGCLGYSLLLLLWWGFGVAFGGAYVVLLFVILIVVFGYLLL